MCKKTTLRTVLTWDRVVQVEEICGFAICGIIHTHLWICDLHTGTPKKFADLRTALVRRKWKCVVQASCYQVQTTSWLLKAKRPSVFTTTLIHHPTSHIQRMLGSNPIVLQTLFGQSKAFWQPACTGIPFLSSTVTFIDKKIRNFNFKNVMLTYRNDVKRRRARWTQFNTSLLLLQHTVTVCS